jgi:hypothetical protein
MKVTGMPAVVLSHGRVLVQDGTWKGEQGAGQFIHRERFGQPAGAKAPARSRTAATAR